MAAETTRLTGGHAGTSDVAQSIVEGLAEGFAEARSRTLPSRGTIRTEDADDARIALHPDAFDRNLLDEIWGEAFAIRVAGTHRVEAVSHRQNASDPRDLLSGQLRQVAGSVETPRGDAALQATGC